MQLRNSDLDTLKANPRMGVLPTMMSHFLKNADKWKCKYGQQVDPGKKCPVCRRLEGDD